ncbi:MAG: hypothetical protein ACR2N0_03450 [Rubrobacteraceae bacterium]|jgi:hypothetical protein|nr:hypothetical protein [Rubrobacter sp.]
MRPTTKRLVSVAALTFAASTFGAVLAIIFQWPTQFDGSGSPNVTAGEFVTGGTATSIPLIPWIALGVFALLARSRRWWGTFGVVGLCLLGPLFVIGGMGEAFAPATPHVPRAVLVVSGVVAGLLGLTLLASGVRDLIGRWRMRGLSKTARV